MNRRSTTTTMHHRTTTVVVRRKLWMVVLWLIYTTVQQQQQLLPLPRFQLSSSSSTTVSLMVVAWSSPYQSQQQQQQPRRNIRLPISSIHNDPIVLHLPSRRDEWKKQQPQPPPHNDVVYTSSSSWHKQQSSNGNSYRIMTALSLSSSDNNNDNDHTTTTTTTLINDEQQSFIPLAFVTIIGAIVTGIANHLGYTIDDVVTSISHPQETIQQFIAMIKDMGPQGIVYFGLFYLIAETLAVPATPLALSAGYLFGFVNGFLVVLTAATIAACIGFVVGKTWLRTYVETLLQENPKFAKIDRAVGQKGFKLLVLVRLSPIFPFSISNYIYGASSIDFVSYFWGTLIGFTPSTLAYVYTGMVGKEVMLGSIDGSGGQPWYIYVAGLTVLITLLKLVSDVATGIIDAIDDDVVVNP